MERNNILDFKYSFGYNSQLLYNLCVCDENIIAWCSGFCITFYDVTEKKKTFLKSTSNGSIRHITKNQSVSPIHIALAQSNSDSSAPLIEILEWPSLQIVMHLKNGTDETYSHLNYNNDGSLLVSLGESPDYNLTIWNWKTNTIKLQGKAFISDIYNVVFSKYIPEQLVSCGVDHIKFWKTTKTFTGLKLKGNVGSFGKTDICDILGILPLPDEKVLSGCTWGNMLLWENGKIKCEIFRKGRQNCHQGPIAQMLHYPDTNEIITIGLDGHICTWYWGDVDETCIGNDDRFIEINPVSERIVPNSKLTCMFKRKENEWFSQDSSGAIWTINLDSDGENVSKSEINTNNSSKIIYSHGGAIAGIANLRNASLLISLGCDGSLLLHKLPNGPVIAIGQYKQKASFLHYPSEKIDRTDQILILGFENGIIKIVIIDLNVLKNYEFTDDIDKFTRTLQIVKPHIKKIKCINTNENVDLLISTSEDRTLFVYKIIKNDFILNLIPLYFIDTPNVMNTIIWKPEDDFTILMAGNNCVVLEARLPIVDEFPLIEEIVSFKKEFVSTHLIYLKNYSLNMISTETNINDNRDFNTIELVENVKETDKSMIWAKYDSKNSSYIITAQENCNCILKLKSGDDYITNYMCLNGKVDDSIASHLFLNDNRHFIVGMNSGQLRIFETPEDSLDSKKYDAIVVSPIKSTLNSIEDKIVHDSKIGRVTHLIYDDSNGYLYTAGGDGNIFSFKCNFMESQTSNDFINEFSNNTNIENITSIVVDEDSLLSHEEFVQEKKKKSMLKAITLHKQKTLKTLDALKIDFQNLSEDNKNLPEKQRIQMKDDPRVYNDIICELEQKMKMVHRKLAYPLEESNIRLKKLVQRNIESLELFPFSLNSIIHKDYHVKIIRQNKLSKEFYDNLDTIQIDLSSSQEKTSHEGIYEIHIKSLEPVINEDENSSEKLSIQKPSTSMIDNLPKSPPPSHQLTKALRNYFQRCERRRFQELEWQEHLKKKTLKSQTSDSKDDDDEPKLGEYCLKSELEIIPNKSKNQTLFDMFMIRKEIFDLQHKFNDRLIQLRRGKFDILQKYTCFKEELDKIQIELPEEFRETIPFPAPHIDENVEYPENNLKISSTSSENDLLNVQNCYEYKIDDENDDERRISNLISKQHKMIRQMRISIEDWENSLKSMGKLRGRTLLQTQFLKLHLLRLTQEQLILDSFELQEEKLSKIVREIQDQLQVLQDQHSILQKDIDVRKIIINNIQVQKKDLFVKSNQITEKNQYSTFLKQVYKEKPKDYKASSHSISSSESKASSSSSEDEKGCFRFDLNTCPPGCDPQIYEEITHLRAIRHKLENDIKEQENFMNVAKNNLYEKNKEIDVLNSDLCKKQEDLSSLRREKQLKLNDIDSVIILNADRCRADALEELRMGQDIIIFSATALETLQHREQHLLKEAEDQNKLYESYRTHLQRMRADCTYMKHVITNLKHDIQSVLEQKLDLGNKFTKLNYNSAKVEASKILDTVLECGLNRFKTTVASGLTDDMRNQLLHWKKRRYELEREYCSALQEHTRKLQTATTLQTELHTKKRMHKSVDVQKIDKLKNDLKKLRVIYKDNQKQIEELRIEVQRLKLKPHKSPILPPITPTNISTPVSIVVTPPPSEMPMTKTETIAISLAKELKDLSEQYFTDSQSEADLFEIIEEILPVLSEGKINVIDAANTIMERISSSKSVKKEVDDVSHASLAEILSQITNKNVQLHENELVISDSYEKSGDEDKKSLCKEFIYVIKGLLDAKVSPEDTGAIDIAVAALIEIAPNFSKQTIDIDEIVKSIQDEIQCDALKVKELIVAITDCILSRTM